MKKLLRKRSMLLVALLVGLCMPAMAKRYYTFNAVALNVDGLPKDIAFVEVNPDGKGASGASLVSQTIVNENWDIIGISEDFNYHNDIVTDEFKKYYDAGKWTGQVTNPSSMLTGVDGLELFVAKRGTYPVMANETLVPWRNAYGSSLYYGFLSDGADGIIEKGFRYYTVTFAVGVIVDVYVLHMDAGTADDSGDYENGKDKNVVVREKQLKQLADYIIAKSKENKRPVIIMGDTNCRYTRENLKGGFIDYINTESDGLLTVKDGWIESVYNGEYPTYPSDALMIGEYGERLGEVVDKVFYINYNYPENHTGKKLTLKANNYRLGTEYGLGTASLDHNPVIINFTLVDETATALTDAEIEDKWTGEASEEEASAGVGSELVDGGTYFLKNLAAKTYLTSGGKWGTQTVAGSAGISVTFEKEGDIYRLKTTFTGGYINSSDAGIENAADHGVIFVDRPNEAESEWTVTPIEVGDGSYQYRLLNSDNEALTYTESGVVTRAPYDESSDAQKWILLTEDDIRTKMKAATSANPYDVTPLLKGADFDRNNTLNSSATWGNGFTKNKESGYAEVGADLGSNVETYCAITQTSSAVSISQTINNLPKGKYILTGQGFYRVKYNSTTQHDDATYDVKVSIGDKSCNLAQNTNTTIGDGTAPAVFSQADAKYDIFLSPELATDGSLTLKVDKPKAPSKGVFITVTAENWVCIDNFKLLYYGDGVDDVNPYAIYENIVIKKMNDTYQLVLKLNEAGQNAYDISTVVYRVENHMVTSEEVAKFLCDMIDEAYANALAAHQAAIMGDVIVPGTDITSIIFNPSFEEGKIGWTNTDKGTVIASAVAPHEDNYYEGANQSNVLVQTVSNLVNGLYELTAYVNSSANTTAFLVGNSYHKGFKTNGDFQEKKLLFLVEDGQAKVGVIGGAGDGNKYYFQSKGAAFKVDYFRFKYISDVPTGRVKLAVADAKEIAGIDENGNDIADSGFDVYAKGSEEFTILKNLLNNCNSKTYTTADAAGAVSEIYASLQAAAKKQKHRGADMTFAITNPNFELDGNYPGWTTVGQVTGYETKVALQENMTYAYVGVDGRKLYNTWDNPSTGVVGFGLTQTVEGLPTGSYKLSAMVASGTGESITLTANGVSTTVAAGADQTVGVPVEVQCKVEKGGDLVISVAGANNAWFKADDFRLTFNGHSLALTHEENPDEGINDWYTDVDLTRTFKVDSWQPLIVPFTMPIPANWDVREFTGIELDETGVHLKLIFSEAGQVSNIEAGKPYMIRNNGEEAMSILKIEHADVVTAKNTLKPQTKSLTENFTGSVKFQGNYGKTTIPQGAYYISGNKFYIASKDIEMKGYRAFFNPDDFVKAKVRSLGMGSRTETFIDSIELEDEVVIGIYDVNGIRLSEMKPGINILHMNNGTTKKVIVK